MQMNLRVPIGMSSEFQGKGAMKMIFLTILRTVCIIVGIVFAVWFLLPLRLSMGFDIGNLTGLAVCILMIAYGIFLPFVHKGIARLYGRVWGRILCLVVLTCALLLLVLVVVETCCMVSAAKNEPKPGNTVVVLGCRVYGERPSRALYGRVMKAYEYLVENPDSVCLLSGGMGPGERITEAECMYRILVEQGISKERLIKEEKSTSTKENLQFCKEIIRQKDLNPEIVIITSDYHQYRAGWLAKRLGFTYTGASSKSSRAALPTFYVRELYGILHQWLVD